MRRQWNSGSAAAISNGRSPNRSRVVALVAAAALLIALALVPPAEAFIYWANHDNNTIARANLDGSAPNQAFIAGASSPSGLAVDDAHIYWANNGTNSIGRANLDGSAPNQSFIPGVTPRGLAVDDAHIYWANKGTNSIGRANLDGSAPNLSFIGGASSPEGVAVDDTHIYWSNFSTSGIGRANLDGSGATQTFIATGVSLPRAVAVNGTHIFWGNNGGYIGRANLDGSAPNQNFIVSQDNAWGVAVDGAHVYWSNYETFTSIGRANLDGSALITSFIPGALRPWGIAVDNTVPVKAKISKVTVKGPASVKKGKKVTYKVKITNSGNAEATGVRLKVSGRGVGFNTSVGKISAGKTRTVKVKIKPKKPGKVTASFKVVSDNAGSKTVKKKITVKR